jgi:hypothetical protein
MKTGGLAGGVRSASVGAASSNDDDSLTSPELSQRATKALLPDISLTNLGRAPQSCRLISSHNPCPLNSGRYRPLTGFAVYIRETPMPTQHPVFPMQESKVTRARLLKYVEEVFACADQDGDGALTVAELQHFLSVLVHPYGEGPDP